MLTRRGFLGAIVAIVAAPVAAAKIAHEVMRDPVGIGAIDWAAGLEDDGALTMDNFMAAIEELKDAPWPKQPPMIMHPEQYRMMREAGVFGEGDPMFVESVKVSEPIVCWQSDDGTTREDIEVDWYHATINDDA